MRDVGLLAVGAIVGFVAAWAKARWIDAPRERAGRRDIERETAHRALADSLNAPRKLVDHAILMHEIERQNHLPSEWWMPIDAAIEVFKDGWDSNWSYTLGNEEQVGDMVQRVWISAARLMIAVDPELTTELQPPNVVTERASELLAHVQEIQDHARRAAAT